MSVIHAPCPQCGSNNNVAIYEDGHEYCFTPGCDYFKPATGIMPTPTPSTPNEIEPVIGDYVEIKSRKIPADSNKFFGYVKGKHGNENAYFWPIYDNQRRLVGYKIRKKNKQFLMH